jgi:hypothetical protein
MSKPSIMTSQAEVNPYKSPAVSGDRRSVWANPRVQQAMNVFAIAFAPVPLTMRVVEETLDLSINSFMERVPPVLERPVALMAIISILLACLLWLISLIINIRGALKLRVMSMIGVLLNVISLIAMF